MQPDPPRDLHDLIQFVQAQYRQRLESPQHCALTSRAFALNAPYRFSEVSSLSPGRPGHGSPLLLFSGSRRKGLDEIRAGFVRANEEHAWIYIPLIGVWIDDTTEVEDGGVAADPFLRTLLMRAYGEIEVFHTHPDGLYRNLQEQGQLPETWPIIAATPSRGDQFGAAMLEDHAGPSVTLLSHVISSFGVTAYQRTEFFRFDDLAVGGPFDVAFESIRPDADPVSEITRIIRDLEQTIAWQSASGETHATWRLSFEPFSE